jgi:hypothetical protein
MGDQGLEFCGEGTDVQHRQPLLGHRWGVVVVEVVMGETVVERGIGASRDSTEIRAAVLATEQGGRVKTKDFQCLNEIVVLYLWHLF